MFWLNRFFIGLASFLCFGLVLSQDENSLHTDLNSVDIGFIPISSTQRDSIFDSYARRMRKVYAGYKKFNYPIQVDYTTPNCSFRIDGETALDGFLNTNFLINSIENKGCNAANLDTLKVNFLSLLFLTNPKLLRRFARKSKDKKEDTSRAWSYGYREDSTFLWLLTRSEKESTGYEKYHKKDGSMVRLSTRNKENSNDSLDVLNWKCKKDIIFRMQFQREERNQRYHPKIFEVGCENHSLTFNFSTSKKWRKLKKFDKGFNLVFGFNRTLGEFK